MNRAERRKYIKENRNNNMASYCPTCRGKTLHYTRPTEKHLCDVVCECCGKAAMQNMEGLIPMVYVHLDALREALKE